MGFAVHFSTNKFKVKYDEQGKECWEIYPNISNEYCLLVNRVFLFRGKGSI